MTDGKVNAPSPDVTPAPSPEGSPSAAPSAGDGTSVAAPIVETPVVVETAVAEKPVASIEPVQKSVLGEAIDAQKDKTQAPVEAPKQDDKSAEVKLEAEPKKEEVAQSDEPAPLPTYEPFTLPEGVDATLDEAKMGDFVKELGELQNLTKADQKMMQEFGQKLVNRHIAEVQETVGRVNQYYMDAFEKQKSEWKDRFDKDPELGGNRRDTTIGAALEFINTHGGTPDQQKEFRELMDTTGVGNHPAMIRILAQAARAMSEGGPLPATKPVTTQSKVQKRYGNS